jgi:flagellar biosynthesis/type III secretory pathway M-ring protein FliF/YscJ
MREVLLVAAAWLVFNFWVAYRLWFIAEMKQRRNRDQARRFEDQMTDSMEGGEENVTINQSPSRANLVGNPRSWRRK